MRLPKILVLTGFGVGCRDVKAGALHAWAPEFGGRKWVLNVRDWPSQNGVFGFWLEMHGICTPRFNRMYELVLFRGRKTRFCPRILVARLHAVALRPALGEREALACEALLVLVGAVAVREQLVAPSRPPAATRRQLSRDPRPRPAGSQCAGGVGFVGAGARGPTRGIVLGAFQAPFSPGRGPQPALNCSCRCDRVTRDGPAALRARAAREQEAFGRACRAC